ncbi:MAG: FtsX-like permease family protein [Bacteroidia bacterium]
MQANGLTSFISRRITHSGSLRMGATGPVIRIATAGIILGVIAVVISIMVVTGFRDEITRKVTGFVADFRITAYNNNESFEEMPILLPEDVIKNVKETKGVSHLQSFILKAGIIKTDTDLQGVVLKGIGKDFRKDFFQSKITGGQFPDYGDSATLNSIVISESLSKKLKLKTGDSFLLFFIQNDKKVRKVKISGIYKTGLGEEFDDLYLFCDIGLLKKINGWSEGQVSGYEVFTTPGTISDEIFPELYNRTGFNYNTQSARQLYPQMFNWLDLQNLNVIVIIALITLVAGVTIISTMLVILLEQTREIGILKSLGAADSMIAAVYTRISLRMLLKGLIIGNAIALGFGWLQQQTGFMKLNEESYYISQVPISFHVSAILLVNAIVLIAGVCMMIIPARVIAGIDPVKVLRFD